MSNIILELTKPEAQSLQAILQRGVSWYGSDGRVGKDAEKIFRALADGAGVVTPDSVKLHSYNGGLPRWQDKR